MNLVKDMYFIYYLLFVIMSKKKTSKSDVGKIYDIIKKRDIDDIFDRIFVNFDDRIKKNKRINQKELKIQLKKSNRPEECPICLEKGIKNCEICRKEFIIPNEYKNNISTKLPFD